jgi:alpha-glucosidase
VTTHKRVLPDERFIGLGEKSGGLNRRGVAYQNWNTDAFGYGGSSDPLYGSHPFYIGLHSARSAKIIYGIFLDNPYRTYFNFQASNNRFASFGAEDGEMNYYLISRGANTSVGAVLEDYTHLTGRTELPPLWSLGYHQCRYSYFPDKEVLNVARTLREKQIPADVIWSDIHYMDAYKVFTWHPERFPQPKKTLAELETMGFKTVVITDPGIKVEKGYAAYEDGVKQNIFLKYPDGVLYQGDVWPGACNFPDFTSPKARLWWGDKLKGLMDDGVDGFWTDMNEPAAWGQSIPNMIEFDFEASIGAGQKASYKKGHNVFGMQMARASYEGAKKHLGGKRPFNLTRASYAGVQRYGAVWTGDNTASDDHLLLGARIVNSMGLAGIPFTGVDVGGFNGGGSRELFARWVALGAFTPFFRVHAAVNTKEQDPWSFGEDVEEVCKRYIESRYKLLPYLYAAFYEASQTGMPVARSLAVEHPFDAPIYDGAFDAEFTLGGSLLVAPCDSRQNFARVYLPSSTASASSSAWYDAHTGKRFAGGQEHVVATPMDKLPVFVRAGAIIPMQSLVQSTAQKPDGTLTLHVFAGADGAFTYYEDDGESYKYEKKDFFKRTIRYDAAQKRLALSAADGTRASQFKTLRVVLHGLEAMPSEVRAGATALKPTPATPDVARLLSIVGTDADKYALDPLMARDAAGASAGDSAKGAAGVDAVVSLPHTGAALTLEWR